MRLLLVISSDRLQVIALERVFHDVCAQCGIAALSVTFFESDAGCHDDAAGSVPSSEQAVASDGLVCC